MKAVVLAAGKGVRLQPITSTRPKHLIPIRGKPLLEHILLSIKAAGVKEAIIVVHHMADRFKDYFGNGKKIGMKLEYAFQPEVLGTANATAITESYIQNDFLMIYGDLLITHNVIKSVLQAHKENKPSASMAVVPVKHPQHYGIVDLKGSYVVDIIEKPSTLKTPSNTGNAGVYVFSTEIFQNLKKTGLSSRGESEITDSLRLLIRNEQPIYAVQISSNEWLDVGRPWDLLEANKRVLYQIKSKINGQIEEGAHVIGEVEISKGVRIRSGAYIEGPVFIDEGSDIGPNCYIRPFTSIGKNVRIGNACEIKNSILMDKTKVGHLSYVGDSIFGEDCNLGAGTITANYRLDGKPIKINIQEEVVDSEKEKLGVFVGDSVKTGINTMFMPGVKIGNNSWIGPNVVVYRDVSPNTFLMTKQKIDRALL